MINFVVIGIILSTLAFSSGKECFDSGECRDSFHIMGEIVNDEFACLEFCQSVEDCIWSTFYPDTSYCQLLKTCSRLDPESCPYCLTSEKDCVPDPPSCSASGECQGIVDQVVRLPDHEECLLHCNGTLGCRWITFHSAASECVLLKSCPLLIESCHSCISSERRCLQPPSPKDYTKLLVAAGSPYLNTVEVINLDESKPDVVCDNLPDLPFGVIGATGKLFRGSTPIICGGTTESLNDSCNCWAFKHGQWTSMVSMNDCRKYPESSVIGLSSLSEVLMVVGGKDELEILASGTKQQNLFAVNDGSVDYYTVEAFDGVSWSKSSISGMPVSLWEQCLVKINTTTVLSVGGVTDRGQVSRETFFYDLISDNWSPGPALNEARSGHGCALLRWTNPDTDQVEPVVVTAGGYWQHSTELLHLSGDHGWVYGARLPEISFLSDMIEYNEMVIAVGGGTYTEGTNKLYKLTTPDGDWLEMKQSLNQKRMNHITFLVPDDLVNCH